MEESRQAGWYKDPHDEDEMRFWDGQCWTDMTRSSAPETSTAVKMPGKGMLNFYKVVYGLTITFNTLVVALSIIFVLSILPIPLPPFVQYHLERTPIIAIIPNLPQYTVLGAIIAVGIVTPIQILSTIIPARGLAANLCNAADKNYASGEFSKRTHDYFYSAARFALKVKKTHTRYCVISSILSAIITLLVHDPLMTAIGNPWADLLSLIILGGAFFLLYFVFDSAVMQKQRSENPKLYWKVINCR